MTDLITFRDVDPMDAATLADWMDTAFYALSKLRGGELRLDGSKDEATLQAIYTGINDLSTRLLPRLQGIIDALIRAHYDAGGTHGQLARAMDVDQRSTAQSRGDKIRKSCPPSTWERWATGELEPTTTRAAEVRPGFTLIVADQHVQVSEVRVYGTGRVEIACGGFEHAHDAADEVTVVARDVPLATVVSTITVDDESVDVTTYRRAN